ncbi:MAG: hypothetical protein Q8P11_00640 [bacterium]|nr:hypothetical protein [bacterium]
MAFTPEHKEAAKKMLEHAQAQVCEYEITERFYSRKVIGEPSQKDWQQLAGREQAKIQSTKDFIEYLKEIIAE